MAAPVVQSLDQILAALQPGYQGQEDVYNKQIAALPGQETGQIQGLNVAEQNSFRDINRGANSKGLAFSGIPTEEQTRYVGEKYLPAVAAVKTNTQNQTFDLQKSLAALGTEKRNRATDTQSSQQKALDDYNQAELQWQRELQKMREQNAFDANQNSLNRAAQGGSGGLSAYQAAELANKASAQYKASTFKSGNYKFTGPNGASISMYQYAQATGNSMLDLLRNSGSAYDKKAYNDAQVWLKQKGEGFALQKLQQHYGKLF